MLTQLATVKARLEILPGDTQYDALLTQAIAAVSARFDRECNRTFARTVNAIQEFPASDTEIIVGCYPIETVTTFELKRNELQGWVEQFIADYVVRQSCVISLNAPMSLIPAVAYSSPRVGRVIYTGGYVLPGTTPSAGQAALPADVESAAVEQVACWFQQRDKLGLLRHWPSGGTFLAFSQLPLLPQVSAMLWPYRRWAV